MQAAARTRKHFVIEPLGIVQEVAKELLDALVPEHARTSLCENPGHSATAWSNQTHLFGSPFGPDGVVDGAHCVPTTDAA